MPAWQSLPAGQAVPQLPQWLLLVCRSAHTQLAASVPHSCKPAGQGNRQWLWREMTNAAQLPFSLLLFLLHTCDAGAALAIWAALVHGDALPAALVLACGRSAKKGATQAWVSQQRCEAHTPLAHALHSSHLLGMRNFLPGTPCRPGMCCHRLHSAEHQTAAQSRSPCCLRRSLQSPACSCTPQPGTRCCQSRRCCRRHSSGCQTGG